MGKKHSLKEVIEIVESHGYKMNTDVYLGNKVPISLICKKHGVFKMRLNSIVSGQGCQKCGREKVNNSRKLSLEYVRSQFERKGYILLANEYINSTTKMPFICNKHRDKGVQYIIQNSIHNGQGCYYCGRERISNKLKTDFSLVVNEFTSNGYKLLSCKKEYMDNKTKNLLYKCPNGHVNTTSYGNFKQGFRCPNCARENNSGELNHNWKGGITKLERALRPELNGWVQDRYAKEAHPPVNISSGIDFYCIHTEQDALEYVKSLPIELLEDSPEIDFLTCKYPKVLEYIRRN